MICLMVLSSNEPDQSSFQFHMKFLLARALKRPFRKPPNVSHFNRARDTFNNQKPQSAKINLKKQRARGVG
jgi:hypothetical protein